MKHEQTLGMILKRINYGEADRIITILTDSHGKITVMARGVRKEKSKLAGGIELFSVSQISYIPGKRDIGTLTSSRLKTHFKHIVKNMERTALAYGVLKRIDKVTEENCESEYFELLEQTLDALNDQQLDQNIIEAWFVMRLLKLLGHEPNLATDAEGEKLEPGQKYEFDFDNMAFMESPVGKYTDKHIKLLRLLTRHSPIQVSRVDDLAKLLAESKPIIAQLSRQSFGE